MASYVLLTLLSKSKASGKSVRGDQKPVPIALRKTARQGGNVLPRRGRTANRRLSCYTV